MNSTALLTRPTSSHLMFVVFWVTSILLFRESLATLVSLLFRDYRYSHVALIPFLTAGLIFLERQTIFCDNLPSLRIGIPLLATAGALSFGAGKGMLPVGMEGVLALKVVALVLAWVAGFVLIYGTLACRAAVFPLCLLFLMTPPPSSYMETAAASLQRASADVTYVLFKSIGVPVYRDGFRFSLPDMEIEITEDCSGFRSTVASFITALVASRLLLRSNWSKACLIALTVPFVIFKNAVRITALWWLGLHISRAFLYGPLHRYSGLLFSCLSFGLMVALLLCLRAWEGRSPGLLSSAFLKRT